MITKPTIHLNGTSAKDLLEGYRAAMEAVTAAIDKCAGSCPNARDYYVDPDPGAFHNARDEHFKRLKKLDEAREELLALALHCAERVK